MNLGKLSEPILKRSVFKQIKKNNEVLVKGADIGMDCALFDVDGTYIATATASLSCEKGDDVIARCIYRATNNLLAGKTSPFAVQLHVMLPERMREIALKRMMEAAEKAAEKIGVTISGGHTEVMEEIQRPIISVTALGKGSNLIESKLHPGQEIVMSKWIAISATAVLAKEREEALLTRYPAYFVKSAQSLEQYYSINSEAKVAWNENVFAMHDVAGGGIYGALWELGERYQVGLEVQLKKIPIKQETVEVCEFFELNPYELRSDGALLMVTDNGEQLVNKLAQEGIFAQVIGRITSDNDKVIVNDDERRFLEPPRKEQVIAQLLKNHKENN